MCTKFQFCVEETFVSFHLRYSSSAKLCRQSERFCPYTLSHSLRERDENGCLDWVNMCSEEHETLWTGRWMIMLWRSRRESTLQREKWDVSSQIRAHFKIFFWLIVVFSISTLLSSHSHAQSAWLTSLSLAQHSRLPLPFRYHPESILLMFG